MTWKAEHLESWGISKRYFRGVYVRHSHSKLETAASELAEAENQLAEVIAGLTFRNRTETIERTSTRAA
jgi:hypothetical protein